MSTRHRERYFHLRLHDGERQAIAALKEHYDRASDSDAVRFVIRRAARELGALDQDHAAATEEQTYAVSTKQPA